MITKKRDMTVLFVQLNVLSVIFNRYYLLKITLNTFNTFSCTNNTVMSLFLALTSVAN